MNSPLNEVKTWSKTKIFHVFLQSFLLFPKTGQLWCYIIQSHKMQNETLAHKKDFLERSCIPSCLMIFHFLLTSRLVFRSIYAGFQNLQLVSFSSIFLHSWTGCLKKVGSFNSRCMLFWQGTRELIIKKNI